MNMKSRAILLLALFFFIIPVYAHAGTGLKITYCEPNKIIGEPPYILLTYEYPQDLKKSEMEITVNGQKAFYEPDGGGFGGGMTSESVLLYVGPPGKKQIKIVVKSDDKVLSATQTIDFRSSGDILLLDRSNGEAILSSDPEFHFFGYFFKNLKIKLNGDYLKFHQEPIKVSADHFHIICRPNLRPGENTLDLTWKSENGKSKSKQYHFYLVKNGVIKQGDSIEVRLGRLKSKMGPFYYAAIKGNSLKGETGPILAKQISWKNYYLSQDLIACVKVKAKQPGKGVIEIYKKEVFYNPPEINRRIDLTVVK
jgi:hypothetical protein